MLVSIGINVVAFNGKLDDYSGWRGLGGLASVDTFYNDDGEFFLNHEIVSKDYSDGSMGIAAQESTLLGYKTRDTAFRSDIGTTTVCMHQQVNIVYISILQQRTIMFSLPLTEQYMMMFKAIYKTLKTTTDWLL